MNRLSVINYKDEVMNFINNCNKDNEVIFFDLETTGTNAIVSKIISCSAIKCKYENNNFTEIARMDQFINPDFHIPEEITEITRIDDEKVKDCPTEYEAYEKIKSFFGLNPMLVGYNSTKFDEKFMTNLYLRAEGEDFSPFAHLDVFTMSKEKVGDLDRYTLENVAKKLNLDNEITFHTSIDDVLATKRVCEELLKEYRNNENNVSKSNYTVKNFRYWKKGFRNERIYIDTIPYSQTYFDNYKKEWISNMNDLDLKIIRRLSLERKDVDNEQDFVKKIKSEN